MNEKELDEETLKEFKKDDMERLKFLQSMLFHILIEGDYGFNCPIEKSTILNKAFKLGLNPYTTKKDLGMLEEMGDIKYSDTLDGYELNDQLIEGLNMLYPNEVKAYKSKIETYKNRKNIDDLLRDIIRELQKETGVIYIEAVKERAAKEGINANKVDKSIIWLCQNGELYETEKGYYLIT